MTQQPQIESTDIQEVTLISQEDRKNLWKQISALEKKAVELLADGKENSKQEAIKLLAKSVALKKKDPFIAMAEQYAASADNNDILSSDNLLQSLISAGLPPHLEAIAKAKEEALSNDRIPFDEEVVMEEVDPGSSFSDTVTEKIRVKVSSFYSRDRSDPRNGKYMFIYKVSIYNEGPEPVQIVGRMWEIEKYPDEKEIVRGAGIINQQPIIPPGDVFVYQSSCPLKVFPPRGKRILGSMSGAYTVCKGNMGQHNFSAKISKFNFILPESVANTLIPSNDDYQKDLRNARIQLNPSK